MNRVASLVLALVALVALTGCAQGEKPTTEPVAYDLPPTTGVFDYQLGGINDSVPTDAGDQTPTVVVRDATAEAPTDAYAVCYVNGFQTQPGESDDWLAKRRDAILNDAEGQPTVDPDWPDEYVLDPSAPAQREQILAVVGPVIDGCARAGFDAVEIDNLDTWTRFERIDADGARLLAMAYIERAHQVGLAVGQKNAAEIADVGHDELGFDFAVVEECAVFRECGAYVEAYGSHVLQVEYPDALDEAGLDFDDVCADADRAPLTILRDRDLVARGEPGYVYGQCPYGTAPIG